MALAPKASSEKLVDMNGTRSTIPYSPPPPYPNTTKKVSISSPGDDNKKSVWTATKPLKKDKGSKEQVIVPEQVIPPSSCVQVRDSACQTIGDFTEEDTASSVNTADLCLSTHPAEASEKLGLNKGSTASDIGPSPSAKSLSKKGFFKRYSQDTS